MESASEPTQSASQKSATERLPKARLPLQRLPSQRGSGWFLNALACRVFAARLLVL
jgi:hypothetical protein